MAELLVTIPEGVAAGSLLEVTTPTGAKMHVTVPPGSQARRQLKVLLPQAAGAPVQAQNMALAPGAWNGGAVGQLGAASNAVHNAVSSDKVKSPGSGVLVPCSACGTNNEAKMICATERGSRAVSRSLRRSGVVEAAPGVAARPGNAHGNAYTPSARREGQLMCVHSALGSKR